MKILALIFGAVFVLVSAGLVFAAISDVIERRRGGDERLRSLCCRECRKREGRD